MVLTEELRPVIARLKFHYKHRSRGGRVNLENLYRHIAVSEILPEPYSGRVFQGYHLAHLSFQELELFIKRGASDWENALRHVKGVYMITDIKSQRRYIGSAYGEQGIWGRWSLYAAVGHGGNMGMRALLEGHDLNYCRRHFKFALLEHMDARTDDRLIIARENYWKQVMDARNIETGLNRN